MSEVLDWYNFLPVTTCLLVKRSPSNYVIIPKRVRI